ncbi:hypothetical protein M2103_002168 [Ereboglobus sp. PH5-5]|uniref:hypothetical protein n=1 Tax=Ereboglobus TaxID=2028344 RepID=UPI0012602418|nr:MULTISPECIES: hypothetical protein [Ereboglobus]MDF9827369.1 hypothetical protein [Ereboglobus sp. PH5-10]MDF9833933.1 hypothetical protein [Ereboglobus sp. PH5-5]
MFERLHSSRAEIDTDIWQKFLFPPTSTLRTQNGHVFQGRYKAILLENATALSRVVDFIHLNPVRAGAVPPGLVEQYQRSSLPEFIKKKKARGIDRRRLA